MSPQLQSREKDDIGTARRFVWFGMLGFGYRIGRTERQFYRFPLGGPGYWLWPLGRWEIHTFREQNVPVEAD